MGDPRIGSCNSNTCMKLSFEGWQMPIPPLTPASSHLPGRAAERTVAANGFEKRKSEERPMDFTLATKQKEWLDRVQSFMSKHVRPAVPIYKKQDEEGARWKVIPI